MAAWCSWRPGFILLGFCVNTGTSGFGYSCAAAACFLTFLRVSF